MNTVELGVSSLWGEGEGGQILVVCTHHFSRDIITRTTLKGTHELGSLSSGFLFAILTP